MDDVEKIAEALRLVFGENLKTGRFLDTTKIPFICKDIEGIHLALQEMNKNLVTNDQFWPIKTLVYGAVGIALTALCTEIIYLVLK